MPSIYRFALRLCRDDELAVEVVQETFMRACRQLERLRDEGALQTWLFRITVNAWRDEVRRRKRLPALRLLGDWMRQNSGPTAEMPAARLEATDQRAWIISEMDALPDRQKQVFYLATFEDMTHREIADVLRISVTAVKATLSIARRKLRERLAAREQEAERR